mmetsp:Transcript_3724/g.13736  ORF Transcript_3724/g.13736 Transcript_3724/m.13736 type:complete len:205 (-) Transcript_3724:300-914(-)
MLIVARTATFLARCPKDSVEIVSPTSSGVGAIVTTSAVLAFPPRLPCSRRVSLLSRYGMCFFFSAKAAMQLPSEASDRLMAFSSLRRRPDTPDFFARSLPARSTRNRVPVTICASASPAPSAATSRARRSTLTKRTAWLRLEWAFMRVAAVARFWLPSRTSAMHSRVLVTRIDDAPSTYTWPPASSRRLNEPGSDDSKSCTSSQ